MQPGRVSRFESETSALPAVLSEEEEAVASRAAPPPHPGAAR